MQLTALSYHHADASTSYSVTITDCQFFQMHASVNTNTMITLPHSNTRHLHFMLTCKYVNLLHLVAIPFNPSSSRLKHSDRSNNSMEVMEGRWRNVDNAWAVKLRPTVRRKDVSSCSDPIPSSNPLSDIPSQLNIASSWSLQQTSNMTG